ncbi:integrase core domain-containing protein [Holospora obtusa]|uniref:integrase core domain-containing protein n=1 Tax=Holospora obtusa TaxID=49893 RepID=UPI0003AF0E70|nr:integrase core domain-containing protein [Holospora obtusa]
MPPKKPEYNGGIERGNRTFREDFRTDFLENSVREMQAALSKALVKYNTYRPHRNLKGLTSMQYI